MRGSSAKVPGPLHRRKTLPYKPIWRRMSVRLRGAAVVGQKAHEGRAVLLRPQYSTSGPKGKERLQVPDFRKLASFQGAWPLGL
jgi:hypothetical protein